MRELDQVTWRPIRSLGILFCVGEEDHWPVKMCHPRSDAYRPRPSRIPQASPLNEIQNGVGTPPPRMDQRSIKRLEDKLKAWRRSLCVKYIYFLQVSMK